MIVLINMPFGAITHPSLALGSIKAVLAKAGWKSRVLNLNFDFAQKIGFRRYVKLSVSNIQINEWLFAGKEQ